MPRERRTAHYTCHVALSDPAGQIVARSEAYCQGPNSLRAGRHRRLWLRSAVRDRRVSPHFRRAGRGRQTRAQPPGPGRGAPGRNADLRRPAGLPRLRFAGRQLLRLVDLERLAVDAADGFEQQQRLPHRARRRAPARSAPLAGPAPAPRRSCRPGGRPALSPSTLPMKPLREWPTSSGQPSACSSWQWASSVRLCWCVLPKPMPGSSAICRRSMPAAIRASRRRAR